MPDTTPMRPAPRRADIVLHLGAHRTASTRIQSELDWNQALLVESGVVAMTPPRPGKRGAFTVRAIHRDAVAAAMTRGGLRRYLALRRVRAAFEDHVAQLAAGRADIHRIIVSEENLLGPIFGDDMADFYPEAGRHLAAFRRILPADPREIHISVRGYDAFIASAYAMLAVYGGPLPPFERLKARLLGLRRGWPALIDEVAATFPQARVVVTDAQLRSVGSRIADLIGHELQARFSPAPNPIVNAAPTVEAIAAAGALGGRSPEPDALVARHAGGTRFAPWRPEEVACLRARYARDLAELATGGAAEFRAPEAG